jgi:hypothetical protein
MIAADEDDERKPKDVDPFEERFDGVGAPDAKPPVPGQPPAPADPAKPIEGMTLDRCLILGVTQMGVQGIFRARDAGLRAEHLESPENKVFAAFESFLPKGRLPTNTEIQTITGVTLPAPTEPYDVETFAKKIVNRALRTKLTEGVKEVMLRDIIKDPSSARDSLAKLVRETSFSLGQVSSYTDTSTATTVLDDYLKAKNRGGGLLGLSSPWPNVDIHSLGLQEGELTVILAKRKMGKSWMLLKWMLHALYNDLKPSESILVVSMEMPVALCYRRMAAIDLKLDYKRFRAGTLTTEEEEKLTAWVEAAKTPDPTKPTIHVIGPNTVRDVADIAAKAAEFRPRCVAIDGFYILGRNSNSGMWERMINTVTEIKLDLCAGLNLPVLATTQFKGTKGKNELTVDADDAAYAKAIGDYADAMRGLVADAEMDANRQRLLVGMESREFRPVDILINFDLSAMNFSEIKVADGGGDFGGVGAPGGKPDPNKPAPGSQPTIISGQLPPDGAPAPVAF